MTNVGSAPVLPGGHVTISDILPAGVNAVSVAARTFTRDSLVCSTAPLECVTDTEISVGETLPGGELDH